MGEGRPRGSSETSATVRLRASRRRAAYDGQMPPGSVAPKRLVLLGGGHAHIHLLQCAARAPLAAARQIEPVLVSPFALHPYSGMLPGYLAGRRGERELAFDLRRLAAAAGARFIEAPADRIDTMTRTVEAGGESLSWDLLSLDVGSQPAGLEVPGVREHAFFVRPMDRAIALRRRALEIAAAGAGREVALIVVGGGAAGVEVALALEKLGQHGPARPAVTLVESASGILPEFSPRLRGRATSLLAARGIRVRDGQGVAGVEPDAVVLDDGTRLRSDLTAWIAGAAPPTLLAGSGLPLDTRGFLLVDACLRAVDGSAVFGAGDCIGIAGHPHLAKAGVYAVREAPILHHNLRATLGGGTLRSFRPQRTFLALLDTADGRALWRWHRFSGHSRWAGRLKRRIDSAFVRRYQGAAASEKMPPV